MERINKKIAKMANDLQGELVDFLRSLIAIPSMSGEEKEVIERIRKEMKKIGYDETWVDPFGNLIGRLGTGDRIIAIDGHCDTVGAGDPNAWKMDPFKGKEDGQVIYGRGASDQKGGLAAAVYSGKIIKEIGIPKNVSLFVVASVLEEDFEGLAWRYIIEEDKIKPDVVVLTEPTDLQINIGQRGRMEIKVRTRGASCHGSAPDRGDNAIYKMSPIIKDIEILNQNLSGHSILGKGTVAVTDIRSTAPSLCAVADSATIHLDRRFSEGETETSCLKEIADLKSVRSVEAEVSIPEYQVKSYTGLVYPVKAYYPMWMMDGNHPLVSAAQATCKSQFRHDTKVGGWDFSTHGVATQGVYNIPSIGFGPGNEKFAHTADDQINKNDLKRAMEFYASFIFTASPLPGLFFV